MASHPPSHLVGPSTSSAAAATKNNNAATTTTAAANYETVFTNSKAGMDDADLNKVKQVVYDMSKNSAHFQNEQRKMEQVEARIARMKSTSANLTTAEIAAKTALIDSKIAALEATRDLTRTWIHVDMDAFFAAVEELANPELRGKAFAVGGMGMISTSSYVARAFGVRSAMPGFIAVKLCPHLIFVPPDFEKYQKASALTREVFSRYDAWFESHSLDEASLDVTEICAQRGVSAEAIAEEIRAAVQQATGGLTCSCGIAPNTTLAKICSDKNKPNGQYVLPSTREAVAFFVATLPIRKIPGIGRVTEHVLNAFQVRQCSDFLVHRGLLAALFSPISMDFFLQCALGLGGTTHAHSSTASAAASEGGGGPHRKGMSCERTFKAMSTRAELEARCRELAHHLAEDMASEGLKGKTLTLKLKLTTFEVRTRALTVADQWLCSAAEIEGAAMKLLRAELPVEIRLMGLRMSNFYEEVRREKGQPSIEEVMHRRKVKQQQQQLQQQEEEEEEEHKDDVGDDGDVHTSQILSAAEEVELTLRDWNQEEAIPPLPPQSAGGKSSSSSSSGAAAGAALESSSDLSRTWSCSTCTYLNFKGQLLCEMCGTTKTGNRPSAEVNTNNKNKNSRSKGKKRSHTTEPAHGVSILGFFGSGKVQKKE